MFNVNNSSLSTEMIKEQSGDYIVEALNVRFSKIVSLYNNLGLKSVKFFKNRDVKVTMKEIDSLITKRFGINFKHINADGFGYAVFTAPPKEYNVINRDIINMYEDTADYLNFMGKRSSNTDTDIDDYKRSETDVLYQWMKSVESIDKQFRKSGVVINLEKAKIDNLPNDYLVYLCVDFDTLIGKAGLTGQELTATMMHEVGHAFTHIEYSYRTVNNTAVIVDSLKSVVDDEMSYKKAIKLSYSKLGGDSKDMDNKNTVTATILTVNKFILASRDMSATNTHSATDSEQLADQFSGKFGIGIDLSTALTKLHKVGVEMQLDANLEIMGVLTLQMLFVSLIAAGSISGAIVMTGALLGLILGVAAIITAGVEMYTGGGVRDGIVYDTDNRRQKRIRNEVVRQLRSSDLPKGVVKEYLNYLNVIDIQLRQTKSDADSSSTFAKLGRMVFSFNRKAVDAKEMDELVEDIMENELYVASNKLKTL